MKRVIGIIGSLCCILVSVFLASGCKAEPKPAVLTSIGITNPADKTEYYVGEELDTTGLEITGYYSNGSTFVLEGWTTQGFDSSEISSEVIVKVIYEQFETSYTVQVVQAPTFTYTVAEFLGLIGSDVQYITADKIPAGITVKDEGKSVNVSNVLLTGSFSDSQKMPISIVSADLRGIDLSSVTTDSMFLDCASLESVDFSEGLTSIGIKAFSGCKSLKSIKVPSGVTEIGKQAYEGCEGSSSVYIPSSVTKLGEDAFNRCYNLKRVDIESLYNWCSFLFRTHGTNPLYYAGKLYINDKEVSDIVIPEGVTAISVYTFAKCTSIKSVKIPSSVKSIGYCPFYYCTSLESITIPSNVKTIGISAFYGCSSLSTVNIESGLTGIGMSAFSTCASLKSIEIPSTVTSIGNNAFYGIPKVIYSGSATGSPWGADNVSSQ